MAKVCRTCPRWFVYLMLIARSFAVVNVQTIGFAIIIAGFIVAYIAGVRTARRPGRQPNA